MTNPEDRFGVFQDEEVLRVLNNDLNFYQLIFYVIYFLIVLLLNINLFLFNKRRGWGPPILYFKIIHIGLFLMSFNDLIISISRYVTDGEYILLGNNKAIFYITGFSIFTIAWTLKISHFIDLSQRLRIAFQCTLITYTFFAIWGSIVMFLIFVGKLDSNTGILGLETRGTFVAALIATGIMSLNLLIMFHHMIKNWAVSSYDSWYAGLQFGSLFIIFILLITRGYALSWVDRTQTPRLHIFWEYKVIPILSILIPTSLIMLQLYLYQPDFFHKWIKKSKT